MKNASPAGLCCGRRLPSYFIKTHKLSEELTNYPEALRLYFIYLLPCFWFLVPDFITMHPRPDNTTSAADCLALNGFSFVFLFVCTIPLEYPGWRLRAFPVLKLCAIYYPYTLYICHLPHTMCYVPCALHRSSDYIQFSRGFIRSMSEFAQINNKLLLLTW